MSTRQPPEEAKKRLVRQWLTRAEQDLEAAETLLFAEHALLYPACFHAQQAGEKFLKAFLTWHQIEFPKTHSLGVLLDLAKQADASMVVELKDTTMLTPYGVEVRYPGDSPEPSRQDTVEALSLARKTRDAVLNRIRGIT